MFLVLFGREAFRCLVLRVRKSARVGANNDEVPPVPIPNTEVKLIRVENTWLETAREDRTMPVPNTGNPFIGFLVILLLSSVGRARGC